MSLDVVDLLAEIADIGRDPVRGGYSRHVYDSAELALRAWFRERAGGLGLDVETDRNGNLWAHWGPRGPHTVATGSHLDSVPGGGAYDGPLGVASSLAAVAALRAEGFVPARPVAVVVFGEEEGSRFGIACLGSKLMAGALPGATAAALTDAAGTTYAEACRAEGVDPAGLGRDEERLAELGAFVELHVEQGRGLVDLDAPVGLASRILAHGRWRLLVTGEGNHAGTTRMGDRRDPVAAAAAVVLAARQIATAHDHPGDDDPGHDDPGHDGHGAPARATVGRLVPVPGGTNVIASRVEMWLDVRGATQETTRALLAEILEVAAAAAREHACELAATEESFVGEVAFDDSLRARLAGSLEGVLGEVPTLATGAGHDAGILAGALPTAMLFTRNPTGVSHSPLESATDEDCRLGARALARVLRDLAAEPLPS